MDVVEGDIHRGLDPGVGEAIAPREDEEEPRDHWLPIGIDLQEVQQLSQYEQRLPEPPISEVLAATIEGHQDTDVRSSDTSSFEAQMLPPQSRRPSDDMSEPLPHIRIHDEDPEPFSIALGLWCEENGVNRTQYSSLREILRLLEPHPLISRLPSSYASLRRRTKGHLPQLGLRRALLGLAPEKLSTMPEQRKRNVTTEDTPPKEYLYFFDLATLFETILRSRLKERMFFGFGEFRSNPVEFWQSQAWTGSVRTTSGKYAHYRNGDALFPSDWIFYQCAASECQREHLGRVIAVGLDYQDSTPAEHRGRLTIKVQHSLVFNEIPDSFHRLHYFRQNEVLLLPQFSFILEQAVARRCENVIIDYAGAANSLGADLPQRFANPQTLVLRIQYSAKGLMHPISMSAPLRSELELQAYGREYFSRDFDISKGNRSLSLPLLMFIDGFGLYRNAYRSLMGIYLLFAAFSFHERNRRANVFPLTLGPHGSNFNDVIAALSDLRHFDRGAVVELPQPTRLCAFTLCFLGDMPQQQANAGFKSQNAILGCRSCLIPATARGNLNFDIIKEGRYHTQTLQQRYEMQAMKSVSKRENFAKQWGLLPEAPSLFKITPALDIINTRPSDPAHSEYAGMCKQAHQLLLETVLTPTGINLYATVLRRWPFAPGFARLQSPIHHLKSYSLSEHARWIVVIPALLRCWLRDNFVHPYFLTAGQQYLMRYRINLTVSDYITKVFALIAKSTSLLMTDNLTQRAQFDETIKSGRQHYQSLLQIAAVAANQNPRSRSVTPSAAGPSRTGSIEPPSRQASTEPEPNNLLPRSEVQCEQQGEDEENAKVSQKAQIYRNDQRRPNMHVAVHYEAVMLEYGMPSNLNVLIGEDKHRWVQSQELHILADRSIYRNH